jgi:hypothetical protein
MPGDEKTFVQGLVGGLLILAILLLLFGGTSIGFGGPGIFGGSGYFGGYGGIPSETIAAEDGLILDGSDFSCVRMGGALLEGISAVGTDFASAWLMEADAREANMQRAVFSGASLPRYLINTDMRGADFTKAYVYQTEFDGADLRGAKGLAELEGGRPVFGMTRISEKDREPLLKMLQEKGLFIVKNE